MWSLDSSHVLGLEYTYAVELSGRRPEFSSLFPLSQKRSPQCTVSIAVTGIKSTDTVTVQLLLAS